MNPIHSDKTFSDQELWQAVASRLQYMPKKERDEWAPLIATLEERDRMTAQALKLAESGLTMMARNMKQMETERSESKNMFQPKFGQSSLNHWRVDPQPGSGGCMWMS